MRELRDDPSRQTPPRTPPAAANDAQKPSQNSQAAQHPWRPQSFGELRPRQVTATRRMRVVQAGERAELLEMARNPGTSSACLFDRSLSRSGPITPLGWALE